VRQLTTECILLALVGGALGLALSCGIARGIVLLDPQGIPRLEQVRPDAAVFLFGLAISLIAGLLFGWLPALQFSRAEVSHVIKDSGPGGRPGHGRLAPRSLLVVGEIALALVLLIGAGLLLRSFALLRAVDPGFQPEGLLTMQVVLPKAVYGAGQQSAEFAARLLERVSTIPSVEGAAVSSTLPMASNFAMSTYVKIEGRQLSRENSSVNLCAVTAGYFRTMGIGLRRGRDFTEADQGRENSVILNQAAVRHFWPGGEDPVGLHLALEGDKPRTVVGVAADVKNHGLDAGSGPEIYIPFPEMPTVYLGLAIRTVGDARGVPAAVRGMVRGLDRNQPVESVEGMRQILDEYVARPRFQLVLLGSFAALALVLAMVGIYGLVSHAVAQRTHEIGIRMALGAESRKVLGMMVRQGAALAAAGIGIGLVGAWAATRVLANVLFGITPHDGATFAAVSLLLLGVCLAASYVPARRAARVDPMVALRHQ
jgi:putative ABC transport system permease protein